MGIDAAGVGCSRPRKDGFFDPTNELIVGRPHLRRRCYFLDRVDTHAGAARGRSRRHQPQRNWLTPYDRQRTQTRGGTRATQSSRASGRWRGRHFVLPSRDRKPMRGLLSKARADAAQSANKKINAVGAGVDLLKFIVSTLLLTL